MPTRIPAPRQCAGSRSARIAALFPPYSSGLDMDDVGDLVIEAAGIMPDASFLPPLETLLEDIPGDEDVLAAIEACRTGVSSPRWCPQD